MAKTPINVQQVVSGKPVSPYNQLDGLAQWLAGQEAAKESTAGLPLPPPGVTQALAQLQHVLGVALPSRLALTQSASAQIMRTVGRGR